jgi:hypothetical protein
MTDPDSARTCLERTRSAVLNVMIGAGVAIACSGLILRWRDQAAAFRASEGTRRAMLAGLLGLGVASYLTRRIGTALTASTEMSRRASRFYRSHVVAAVVGALAVPLGLAYGWTVRPRLDAVAPFWVVALALGSLALPREAEIDVLEPFPSEPAGPTP